MKKLIITALFLTLSATAFATSAKVVTATKEEWLKNAANVDYVQYIKGQDKSVKLFSVSGGDPAMNGTFLNLAVFSDIDMDWNVFELANVRQFQLLPSTKKGFLKIKLVRDSFDSEGNNIQEKSVLFLNIEKSENASIESEEIKS
jgi:hypothetical protein